MDSSGSSEAVRRSSSVLATRRRSKEREADTISSCGNRLVWLGSTRGYLSIIEGEGGTLQATFGAPARLPSRSSSYELIERKSTSDGAVDPQRWMHLHQPARSRFDTDGLAINRTLSIVGRRPSPSRCLLSSAF